MSVNPIVDETGAITHLLATSSDLTQYNALQRRFQNGFETAPHGWAFADTSGRITEANDAFCRILDRSRADVIGHRPRDFTFVEDSARTTPFGPMCAGAVPDTFSTRKRYVSGHGALRWVDLHVQLVRDHLGRPEYFFSHIQDITDWIEAQRQAEHAEHAYRDLFNDVVFSIGTALELRDPFTAGHQRRVAELSAAIGAMLGLGDGVCAGLRVGASLHDMGKVATPSEILTKPARLDDAEYAMVKRHPRAGHDIVARIAFPWPVAVMILQHHERLDGSGYPDALRGDEISLEARILAVADTVETIVSHRPYRPARTIAVALDVVHEGRGRLFDTDVVAACVSVFDSGFAFGAPPRMAPEPREV